MKIVKYLDEHFEELLLVLFSFVMVAVIAMQVFMRFVLGNSLSWSEELARYCFIWLVYIGISYGVKKQRHIKVDVLLILLKERGKMILGIIANLFFLGFAIFVIIVGFELVEQQMGYGQTSPSMKVPMYIVYAATPVGMSLTSIRIIQQLYMQVLTLLGKRHFTLKTEADDVLESEEVKEHLK
ncbi:TRAP transporter small permease [Salibacterium salarium]|uniref:TRAP transporter small permease n=1 Tax=Salibacterium salarium TaxID=284579 RepID=A0A3R9QUV3_9BACI|nr:TRAP transporter small permease [Salibacterium salarium]RSL33959.1 TRAP transporter small permease [Salibacterium salarium]